MASSDSLDEHVNKLWEAIEDATGESWGEANTAEYKALVRTHLVALVEKVVQDSATTKLVLAVQAALPQLTAMRDQARHLLSRGEHSAAAITSVARLDKILQAHGALVLGAGPVEAARVPGKQA